jgi:hypothetical protein
MIVLPLVLALLGFVLRTADLSAAGAGRERLKRTRIATGIQIDRPLRIASAFPGYYHCFYIDGDIIFHIDAAAANF